MKTIVLNNKAEAIQKGFGANWEFVHDKVMSPDGIDVMFTRKQGVFCKKGEVPVEVTHIANNDVRVYFTTSGKYMDLVETLKHGNK